MRTKKIDPMAGIAPGIAEMTTLALIESVCRGSRNAGGFVLFQDAKSIKRARRALKEIGDYVESYRDLVRKKK